MKTTLLYTFFSLFAYYSFSQTIVPDDQFEMYLETHDANGVEVTLGSVNSLGDGDATNNSVPTAKIEVLTTLDVSGKGIQDMTGIQDFVALETLNCSSNNFLAELNVFQNIALKDIRCFNCNISSLTLPDNNTLSYLNCGNNNLSTLDVSGYPLLEYLACYNNSPSDLGTLDLSSNTALKTLYCHNSGVNSLDVTQCSLLEFMWCYGNNISTLDITTNTVLSELRCYNSGISTFNYTNNTALETLDCSNNPIGSLNVSLFPNLVTLNCISNNLITLDISINQVLEFLDCGSNLSLTILDLPVTNSIKELECYSTALEALDLSNLIKLQYLDVYYCNNLSSLILPQTITLTELWAYTTGLSNLDFTKNTGLQYMDIAHGNFTSIDVSMLPNLKGFYCNENALLNELNIANGFIDNLEVMWAHDNPLLKCIQVDDLAKATAKSSPDWKRDVGSNFSENCTLDVESFNKVSLQINPNPSTGILNIIVNHPSNYIVSNVLGKKVFEGHLQSGNNTLNFQYLTSGIYFFKVRSFLGDLTKKVIIE